MPDQALYLFNNQFYPDVIDKAYSKVRASTWHHGVHDQQVLTQHYLFGGPIQDFTKDVVRNANLGFPQEAYATFIPYRLLQGHQKYFLEHFVRRKELMSLRDILQNPVWEEQYIFHFVDYVFMNLKFRVTQEGTWLVIPIGTPDGISESYMQYALRDYDNDYTPNEWFIEQRPKVSYGYKEDTLFNLLQEGNRLYFKKFSEMKNYLDLSGVNDWRICVSDRTKERPLMRMTPATMKIDENGDGYLELSDAFLWYIKDTTFPVHCFIFHEGQKAGYTISPNYIGPSGYLFTKFDEYIATIDSHRLKVLSMNPEGGWTAEDGFDRLFDETDDLVVCGFRPSLSWIALPTKNNVPPVSPAAFRVWEYDYERDTLGRMIAHEMSAVFPNLYTYTMKSEAQMVYIEWFRDDNEIKSEYWDFMRPYREYAGAEFFDKLANGTLPEVIKNFEPYVAKYSVTDFVKHLLMESSHDYRVHEMKNLLAETGLCYDILYEMIDRRNTRYRTFVLDMAKDTATYQFIQDNGYVVVASTAKKLSSVDVYIDGKHQLAATGWKDFDQVVALKRSLITPTSVIIIDVYESTQQYAYPVTVEHGFINSMLPQDFPISHISASDLTVATPEKKRLKLSDVIFGIFAQEMIVQIPYGLIDWDELGISQENPDIIARTGVSPDGTFKALTFSLPVMAETTDGHLLSSELDRLTAKNETNPTEHLLVRGGKLFAASPIIANPDDVPEGVDPVNQCKWTKRIKASNMVMTVKDYAGKTVVLWNSNVYRMASTQDLSENSTMVLHKFCGALDFDRFLCFVDGKLGDNSLMTGSVLPDYLEQDMTIQFNGTFDPGTKAEVVYLPFPVDRFTFTTDDDGFADLTGTDIRCIRSMDMIYANGLRIPTKDIHPITNQLVKCPTPGTYTILRLHSDGNLYGFEDEATQSFYDKLFAADPGFKAWAKEHI